MKKTTKIIVTIVSILLVLGLAAWFFIPRIYISLGTKAILPDVGEAATYFTAYDVRSEDVQTISNGHIAIDIPAEYVQKDVELNSPIIYQNSEKTASILLTAPDDRSDLNLMNADSFSETVSGLRGVYSVNQIRKGFERLGNGLPDSAYNTYKCIHLLDEDDNSFWNFNQGLAFLITGTLKGIVPAFGEVEIYETEDICGFVEVSVQEDGSISGWLTIYRADDLNTVSSVKFTGMDRETIYAVMNSAAAE